MERSDLTKRQRQVLDMLMDGKKPTEIGKRLGISPNGVYQHRRRLKEAGFDVPESNGTNGAGGNGRARPARRTQAPAGKVPSNDRLGILTEAGATLDSEHKRITAALDENADEREQLAAEMEKVESRLEGLKVEEEQLGVAKGAVSEARSKLPA